jgi:hypothetical protein
MDVEEEREDGIRLYYEALLRVAQGAPPPKFTFKASDVFAIPVLKAYRRMLLDLNQVSQEAQVRIAQVEFEAWQAMNPDQTHIPTHEHTPQLEVVTDD